MSMIKVARIQIITPNLRYQFTVPNMDHEGAKQLVLDARVRGQEQTVSKAADPTDPMALFLNVTTAIFEFENEYIEINEDILSIHQYIKDENYGFPTPDIRVHNR